MEKIDIAKLKPNPGNPRQIKQVALNRLVKSIKDFPEMLEIRPLVVNDDLEVLGGNMRLQAMKKAGHKTATIIRASKLTPEQQKEFIIKDNTTAGSWDFDTLANEYEIADLADWGMDIDFLLDSDPEEITDPDDKDPGDEIVQPTAAEIAQAALNQESQLGLNEVLAIFRGALLQITKLK